MELEQTPFQLQTELTHLETKIAPKAREKGLELQVMGDPAIPAHLLGDPLRLRQVLTHLANNAVKFTHQGRIEIRARHVQTLEDQVTLVFSVRDSGIGMTPEQMENLFQPFRQADASSTRQYGGTGLGLAICKQLTEMMGGAIQAESRPDQGSLFTFSAVFTLAERSEALHETPASEPDVTVEAHPSTPKPQEPPLDPQALGVQLQPLKTMLEACDTDADECLEEILADIGDAPLRDELLSMQQAIGQYDFDRALEVLEEVMAGLG